MRHTHHIGALASVMHLQSAKNIQKANGNFGHTMQLCWARMPLAMHHGVMRKGYVMAHRIIDSEYDLKAFKSMLDNLTLPFTVELVQGFDAGIEAGLHRLESIQAGIL